MTLGLLAPAAVGAAPIGQLTQLSGVSGCVSETGTSGSCVDGRGLDGAGSVAISPDGSYLYVAAFDGSTVATFSRNTTTGVLTQLSGTAGCIAETGDGVTCADGRGLSGAVALVVSPDGNHVYVASRNNTVAIFSRSSSTGVLTQLNGTAGCIAETGDGVTCADGVALVGLRGIAISPDGKSVYVTARDGSAVAIFSRNAATGVLTQLSGTAGCVSSDGTGGSCVQSRGLLGARGVIVSPDNLHVYIASQNSSAVAVFARNTSTGALTQLSGTAGCIADTGDGVTCADGRALLNPIQLVVSPDGKQVYVASAGSSAIAIFSRNTTTGALTQLSATAGCIAETGDGVTCADGKGLSGVAYVTVSPDGATVYAAANGSNAVTAFSRNVNTGALTQLSGLAGCVSEDGTSGTCTDGLAVTGANAVVVSPSGTHVYAVSYLSDAVTSFLRDTGGVPPLLSITTGSPLPSGTVGTAYSQTFAATGGTTPYTWSMTAGAVPLGLTLSSSGVLSGTPTATGTANFTVGVADSGTQTATHAFALTINPAAPIGQLTQLSGVSGCVSETGTSGSCVDGRGLDGAGSVAISPDGGYLYVAAFDGSTVATFSRNTTTGVLTQLSGTAGCIAETGDGVTCADGRGLSGAVALVVSPDGNHVYVASRNNTVAIFSRNSSTGVLTQLSGTAGCIAETGDGVTCADGVALVGLRGIAISPDGKSVYVTARDGSAVAIFSRNTATGVLTQLSGTAGCVSSDGTGGSCVQGRGLLGARGVIVSPDNLHVYIASQNSSAVAVFARNTTTGALTQLGGTAGCIADTGDGVTCADGRALLNPIQLVVSPDGKQVYVASTGSSAIAIFSRNTTTGALTQLAGTAGCIAETGDGVTCADGKGLNAVVSVTVSPDGATVYGAANSSNAITVFSRNVSTGVLTQFSGLAGCVSEDGTSGTCTDGLALIGADAVIVSPNGAHVYAVSYVSDAVTSFSRSTGGTPPPLSMTTTSPLPNGNVGTAYSQTFAATGGTTPYTWSVTAGAVPLGLTLSSAGVLSGTPTATGTANFTVRVADSGAQTATRAFALTINASTSSGQLTQLSGVSGCVSETGTSGTCVDGRGLDGAGWVALSPDGNYAYVAAFDGSTVAIFSRNTTTGVLTQLSGTAGCIAETGDGVTCADGRGLSGAVSLAVSPDGKHVYVASRDNTVAIFSRSSSTGVLTQLSGTAGCIADTGDGVTCADGNALVGLRAITISPDGTSVYVTARDGGAVAVFARNATTGVLTQLSGTSGCVSSDGTGGTCAQARGLAGARGVTVSPDNRNVYVAAEYGNAVAVFTRNTTTGALTQLSGTAGCVMQSGDGVTCANGRGLTSAVHVELSPDGHHVYVASRDSQALTIFSRNTTTGALTQLSGTAGCIAETGDGVTCADGKGLNQVVYVTVSPDGSNVYAAAQSIAGQPGSNALTAFARDTTTGQLTQLSGLSGCISEDGTSGTCTDGNGLLGALALAVSPDGRYLYAASYISDAVTVFSRAAASPSAPLALSQAAPSSPTSAESVTALQPGAWSLVDGGGVSIHSQGLTVPTAVGYASVQPDSGGWTPAGLAIAEFRRDGVLMAEAALSASPLLHAGRLYAEVSGAAQTGVAITNPNDQPATLSFFFTDQHGDVGQGRTTIPGHGQLAAFLDEAPFRARAVFRGAFTFRASLPVSVAALHGVLNERGDLLMTALPVDDLDAPADPGPSVIPTLADGGGWTTQIVLVNRTDTLATGTVELRGPSGQAAPFTVDGQATASVAYAIPPRAAQTLQTPGAAASLQTASARVVPTAHTAAPAGLALLSQRTGGTTIAATAVPAVATGTTFRLYAEAAGVAGAAGSIQSGLAVANVSAVAVTLTVELHHLDGSPTGRVGTVSLPANGQGVILLNQIPGLGALPAAFEGVLQLSTPSAIAVLGVRARYNERGELLLATMQPTTERTPASTASLVLPYVVDGAQSTTHLILFSGQAGQAASGTWRFFSPSGAAWDLPVR